METVRQLLRDGRGPEWVTNEPTFQRKFFDRVKSGRGR